MTALFSTGLETTPSSGLEEAGSSPREGGFKLVAMLLAMSALLLAGWILLESASGLQPGDALPASVSAPQDAAQAWRPGAAKLPREWTWRRQAVDVSTMYRRPR